MTPAASPPTPPPARSIGYDLIWFLLLLGPIAYFVQEMTVRLGAVTKRGHAEAIFDAFGPFWGWFSLFDLMHHRLADPRHRIHRDDGGPAASSVSRPGHGHHRVDLDGRSWSFRAATGRGKRSPSCSACINLIYIPAPSWCTPIRSQMSVAQGWSPLSPAVSTATMFFFLMANIGTTIAPWMIFFQQSAVVDKGLKEKDILWGQLDTRSAHFSPWSWPSFYIIVTGTVLKGVDIRERRAGFRSLMGINKYAGTFLAIGLFDAGFLGAICISLSSSWAVGEVFGWAHSLNNKIKEAPWFYAFYFISLLTAGIVVLIPGAPLVVITLFVQVVATTLLPAALVFLILLLNNEELMGKYKNNKLQNIINFTIVLGIILLSTGYSLTTLFPNWLGK